MPFRQTPHVMMNRFRMVKHHLPLVQNDVPIVVDRPIAMRGARIMANQFAVVMDHPRMTTKDRMMINDPVPVINGDARPVDHRSGFALFAICGVMIDAQDAFYAANHTADDTADDCANRSRFTVSNRCAMCNAARNALRLRRYRYKEREDKNARSNYSTTHEFTSYDHEPLRTRNMPLSSNRAFQF